MSLMALRERMPLIVVLLLGILLVGLACLCVSDHATQALQRFVAALADVPAVVDVWRGLPPVLFLTAVFALTVSPRARSPQAELQRFRF